MKFLRKILDGKAHLFESGGKLERLYPLWEAQDTILYGPDDVAKGTVHARDAIDLKRIMLTVIAALIPATLMALYNTGYQANLAIAHGAMPLDAWQMDLLVWMQGGAAAAFAPTSVFANMLHGLVWYLPVFIVTLAVGGLIEALFAIIRRHEINEGFLVTLFLFPAIMPPTIPLWQVALGIAFAVILAKEVFGGTGMNVLNVALTGRAFLFFAYPGNISGDQPWIAVDTVSQATPLAQAAAGNLDFAASNMALGGQAWMDAFLGFIPGSMGETSALAALIGAFILIMTQIASWRTIFGVIIGTIGMAAILNAVGSETNPSFAMPFWWHMVLGGWAFGMAFMATDPVTSAFTGTGKLIYGLLIGVLVVLVRVVNPAYPEGMMLAILFMNMFAPFIDHFVVQANIKRRMARHGA